MRTKALLAPVILAAAAWVGAQLTTTPAPLAEYFPGGALLYVEARDFAGLLNDWNTSTEKPLWLKSANYEVFSRSRLFLRLQEAQAEFAEAAGLGPDMALVNSVAGKDSAIAIYNIGKLEFLYMTRLAASNAITTALWQTRTSYESRSVAGKEYFVRSAANGRVAAFAAADGYLLLGTREDLVSGSLALMAKQGQSALASEGWFAAAVKSATRGAGEIRMVLNMADLLKTPYFRSYWVQRNTSELRQFAAGIVDFVREGREWREERVLVRHQAIPSRTLEENALQRVVAWVPDDAVLYRAWARPRPEDIVTAIRTKIVSPGVHAAALSRQAPQAMQLDGTAGSDTDLEIHIDQPSLPALDRASEMPEFRAMLERTGVEAAVVIENSRRGPDGVFVLTETAVGVLGAGNWPSDAASLLPEPGLVRTAGSAMVIAGGPAMLDAVAALLNRPPAAVQAVYTARYLHSAELPQFEAMMRMIDASRVRPEYGNGAPPFFSGNVASLGRVLGRTQSASITVRDQGTGLRQQVVYRMAQ